MEDNEIGLTNDDTVGERMGRLGKVGDEDGNENGRRNRGFL